MPEFVNPFSGKLPKGPLTDEELIRAIRLDIAAEEEAVHLYRAHADATDNKYAKEVLNKVADEEVVHVGEFQKLLSQLDKKEAELINKGAEEASPATVGKGSVVSKESRIREGGAEEDHLAGKLKPLMRWKCPECGKISKTLTHRKENACPKCGAQMKKMDESKVYEYKERDLDKVARDMFGKNFQDLPDYDHQDAVKGELKRRMLAAKNKGKKFTEKDFYTKDAWDEIQAKRNKNESKVGTKKMQKITEAKDVQLYKQLLNAFGAYCDSFPATSMDGVFDIMVEKGKKVIPSDKRAVAILKSLLEEDNPGASVQKIMNTRFSDLPTSLKPIAKSGKRHEIAFWCKDKKIFDLTRDLLSLDSTAGGFWADANGKKVTLLDTQVENDG